jgi:hypothetical protein
MLQAITLKLKPWKLKPLKALVALEGMQQSLLGDHYYILGLFCDPNIIANNKERCF